CSRPDAAIPLSRPMPASAPARATARRAYPSAVRADRGRTDTRSPSLSSGCGWINDGAVPVFDELAVAHAERVEREHLVELSRLRGRVLAIVFVDDGDDVALGGDDFVRVAGRGCRACAWTASGSAAALRWIRERRLELFVVAHLVVFRALLERGVVLLVARVGERDAVGALGAKKLHRDFSVCVELRGRRRAAWR